MTTTSLATGEPEGRPDYVVRRGDRKRAVCVEAFLVVSSAGEVYALVVTYHVTSEPSNLPGEWIVRRRMIHHHLSPIGPRLSDDALKPRPIGEVRTMWALMQAADEACGHASLPEETKP